MIRAKKGYIRVSAFSQEKNTSLAFQRERVEAAGVPPENIVEEVGSAATLSNRPKLKKLLDELTEGDVLIVASVDRFSRRIVDTIFAISSIDAKGAYFRSLDFPNVCNWKNAQDVFQTVIFAFLAEIELENRARRVKAGIARARLIPGKYSGRKPKITSQLLKKIELYRSRGLSPKDICSLLKIGRSTYYKALKQLGGEAYE